MRFKFKKTIYPKIALLKAAYNFTDRAYLHLDADADYYFVDVELKSDFDEMTEAEFENEMLTQSLRHEVYKDTKNIRELLMARALATTVVTENSSEQDSLQKLDEFQENDIVKDWFADHE